MISGKTRSSRSRYSSPGPAAQGGGGPLEASKNSANEASRAFMRRWMEPAVQNKASYEEAGMMRYGVLENMQPLGSLPKASTATKKGAAENNGPVRKIILRASGAGGGRKNSTDSADGAEAHKAGAAPRRSSVPQGNSSRPSPAIITPSPPPSSVSLSPTVSPSQRSPPPRTNSFSALSLHKHTSKGPSHDSSEKEPVPPEQAPPSSEPPARHPVAMKDQDDDYQPKVSKKRTAATRSPVIRRSSTRAAAGRQSLPTTALPGSTMSGSDGEPEEAAKRREVVGKVVSEAVQAALAHHRYPSAYALRTLYDENSSDPRVMAMFEDVFLQRADADTIDQFTTLVSRRKRQGARNNVAYRHWERTGSPETPLPAPFGHLLKHDQGESTPAQKRKKTTHEASPSLSRSRRSEAKISKGSKEVGGNAKEPTTPTKSRGRSNSMDSDSSLSSVASFDTPSLHDGNSLSIVAQADGNGGRRRPQIKLKSRPPQETGAENRPERQTRSARASGSGSNAGSLGTETSADALAGARDEVSGASGGRQPMAGRGKTAVAQQRKSPATTGSSANPARAGAPKNKSRDRLSPSPSTSPQTPTLSDHQPSGSRDAASPDEVKTGAKPRDMPGTVAPLFPNLPVKTSGLRTALQSDTPNLDSKKRASRSSAAKAHDPAKRRDASVTSETRARSETPASTRRTRNATRTGAASTPAPAGSAARSTRSALKRAHDEVEGTASPTASSFRSNAPSEAPTRASTPALPPPSKRQRVGPRVKTSPKKSGNTAAGVPRPTGEGVNHLPGAGAVANRDQIENDDYCSACGGNGDLICCDSCSKSFHFECVDLVGSAELPDDWFCDDCIYKRSARRPDHRGPFGPLLNLLERTIPRAFSLPKKVQTYFEDIKAGVNGEYEEIDRTKTAKKEKNQEFDWFQQRDADGNAILCHGCQRAAAPGKLILPCSACPLWWHLDCLDTPAAHPPNPKKWVCPAHVDHFLYENAPLGHRFRKVRGAQVIKPLYSRGNRNNGVIEVEDSEEEDSSGWNDVRSFGRVLRLPARGIKLDFIEQKIGAGRISKDAGVLTDATHSPFWDVADAEAAIALCHLRDLQEAAPENEVADHNADEAAQPAKAPDALALLGQIQKGQLAQEALTATDKQALRAAMETIKTMLGDEQQETTLNDGIYDGASTTPEGTEEAVTPKAETDKAGPSREEAMGMSVDSMRNGIEVVEGEGEVVGGVLPEKSITVKTPDGEAKE